MVAIKEVSHQPTRALRPLAVCIGATTSSESPICIGVEIRGTDQMWLATGE